MKKYFFLVLFFFLLTIQNVQANDNNTDDQSYNNSQFTQDQQEKNLQSRDEGASDNDRFKSDKKDSLTEPLNTTGKAVDVIQGLKNIFRW